MPTVDQLADHRDALMEKRDSLLLRHEVGELEEQVRAIELANQAVMEGGWGELVDPHEWLHDDPDFLSTRRGVPLDQISDRAEGRNRPIWENETELSQIRGTCRLIADLFPYAKCATKNLTNFIFGKSFHYKVTPRASADTELAARVQGVMDDFLRSNRWPGRREREAFGRAVRDGETYIALEPQGHRVKARFAEPAQVVEPADPRAIEDWIGCTTPSSWTFGVHSRWEDADDVLGYYVQRTDSEGNFDYIPASRMVHMKRNVDTGIKRGLSDFFAVQSHLVDVGKLERNVARGASVLSAIIGIREHPTGVGRDTANSFVAALAYRRQVQSTPQGSRTVYTQKVEPGSWLDVPHGMQYKQSPLANQGVGAAFVTIEQALLRTIGANWCMPEYMISGDASNANYASTMVAESPFVKNCEAEQGFLIADFTDMLWKALALYHAMGAFGDLVDTFGELVARVLIVIAGPRVAARDADKETGRRERLNENGILSDETWANEEGYDLETERGRGAVRREKPGGLILGPAADTAEGRLNRASNIIWEGYP